MLRNSNKPEKNPAAQAPQNERLASTNIHSKHSPVPGAPGLPALMMPVEQMPPTGQSGVLRHLLSPSASISCLSVGGGPCQPRFTKRFPGVATVLVCAEHMKPSGHIWMRSQLENMQQPHHLNGLKPPPRFTGKQRLGYCRHQPSASDYLPPGANNSCKELGVDGGVRTQNQRAGGGECSYQAAVGRGSPTVHLFITALMAFKDGCAGTEPTGAFTQHPPPPSELCLTCNPAE